MSAERLTYTTEERTAIGELLHLAEMCQEAAVNSARRGNTAAAECNRALGAIVAERAACIIRGEAGPLTVSDEEVVEFAAFWGADQPAAFNQPRRQS